MYQLASRFGRDANILRGNVPLTIDQMRKAAPSIFAAEAHSSRSEKYQFFPTSEVLTGLLKEGFAPYAVTQARSRIPGKEEFTKHMIRLRQVNAFNAGLGEDMNEIILLNSHDGTSAYQILPGVYRKVCMNGLVAGENHDDIRVRHSGKGNLIDNVIDGVFRVVEDFETIAHAKEGMKGVTLNPDERRIFATAALSLKYDPEHNPAPISADQLVIPKRLEDRKLDLWTVLNVAQENLIRGGIRGRNASNTRTTTREVKGIDQNIKLNRAIWTLGEEMKKLKA